MNGTWNGSKWVGNFLSTQYSSFDTEIDPGVLTFLNVLIILCLGGAGAFDAAKGEYVLQAGGSWTLRQLI